MTDEQLNTLQKHASAFAKCSASLCKATEKADNAVWRAAHNALEAKKLSKDKSLKMANAVKHSIERVDLLTCRYEKCQTTTRVVLEDVVASLKNVHPSLHKRGVALLKKRSITPEEYADFMIRF